MGKIKTRLKQIRYYVLATVAAGAVFGGLAMVGKTVDVGTNEEVICIVGDTGNANDGQAKVAQAMHDAGCTTLLHTGDVIYPVGLKSADDKRFKTHFFDYYEDFNKIVVTLGNHDGYQLEKGMKAWIDLALRYSNIVYPSHFFQANIGDMCVVSWNSEIVERADDSEFVQKQGDWIDGLDLSKCKTKVSISHHPLFSSGNHGNAKKPVAEFYEKHIVGKFDYAFQGHDHDLEDAGVYKGTRFIVSGAGSELRKCNGKSRGQCWAKLGFVKMTDTNEPEFVFLEEK